MFWDIEIGFSINSYLYEEIELLGLGGVRLTISMLSFYSDDLSLNPAEDYNYFVKMLFPKNEDKVRPFK